MLLKNIYIKRHSGFCVQVDFVSSLVVGSALILADIRCKKAPVKAKQVLVKEENFF